MTKRLRLAAAELTDVGRRRERNQDNVIHFVPTEDDVLERRGALFVVCDGMGGHAAGEIASDIGVRTIREEYFREVGSEDVISALARAIRAANAAIFEHARDNASHSGMGTTCVVLALAGGRAYFANIGDSRAYLVRDGSMRQVTLDHSWVAEQVRAGVLTEDQARTHSHRNVITRSLGTQPDITADLFIETMREGDRVLLCSDGLHGYVPEAEIQRVVVEHDPEPGVHQLIDMANGNGGPDNITAVLVHLVEVPVVTNELVIPEAVAVRNDRASRFDDTTRPLPHRAAARAAAIAERAPDDEGAVFGANGSSADFGGASAASEGRQERRPAAWPAAALRVLAVAALVMLTLGIWDVLAGPYAASRAADVQVQQDVSAAQSAAHTATGQDPRTALVTLAVAQQRLEHDLHTLPLDSQNRTQVRQTLDNVLAPAVRTTLDTYNRQNLITWLPASAVATYSVSCGGATLSSGPNSLVAPGPVTPATGAADTSSMLYALSGDNALYAVSISGSGATCAAPPVIAQGVKAITGDGPQTYALVQASGHWTVVAVDMHGKVAMKLLLPVDATHTPVALAVFGGNFYVAFNGAGSNTGGIWHFWGKDLTRPAQTVATSSGVTSISATATGTVFALLADGSLARVDGAGHALPAPVSLASPVLSADPSVYVSATPVPTLPTTASPPVSVPTATATPAPVSGSISPAGTATAPGATSPSASPLPQTEPTPTVTGPVTLFVGASTLATDRASTGTLVVGDGAAPRVVRFDTSGPDLRPIQQYVYGPPLSPLQSVTVSADGTRIYAWSGAQLVMVTLPA